MHAHWSALSRETKQYGEGMRRKRERAQLRETEKVARRRAAEPRRGSSPDVLLGTRRYPQVVANARDRSRRQTTAVKRLTLDFGPASKFNPGTRYPGTQDDQYLDTSTDGYEDLGLKSAPRDLNLDPPRAARDAARGQNQTDPKFGQLDRPVMHDSSDGTWWVPVPGWYL